MEMLCISGCHIAWRALNSDDPHAAGRQILRQLYTQVTGDDLPPICLTERGKPYFADGDWHFSISHTKKHVFCCLCRENVGLDAEEADRAVPKKPAYLSPSEHRLWEAAEDRAQAYLRLWVLKEAYAKLTGKGLGSFLKETFFSPDDPRITEIGGCFVAVMTEKDNHHAV